MPKLPHLLLLLTLTITTLQLAADPLKPFTSDGCSLFPDGTYEQQSLWMECCIRHDIAYWQGGTRAQRLAADEALEACVSRVGEPEVAKLMLAGVRFGGSPYFPTWYRWGYGWPYKRGYTELSGEEKQQIKREVKRLKLILQGLEQALETPLP
jgi:hypothetical protein